MLFLRLGLVRYKVRFGIWFFIRFGVNIGFIDRARFRFTFTLRLGSRAMVWIIDRDWLYLGIK